MNKKLRKGLGLFLVLAIPILYIVFFKPALIVSNVESGIADKLQKLIGPAAFYKVKIDSPLPHLVRGDMGDVAVMGSQVRLQNGIVAERLDISLDDVKANITAGAITSIGDDTFSVTINQGDLNRYVAATFPEIPDLCMELHNGKITVTTAQEVVLINSKIKLDGTVDIEDGHKLMLRLHDVEAGRKRLPESIKRKMEDKLNPILDTSEWSLGTQLRTLAIRRGRIEVSGKVDPKDLASLQRSSSP